MKLLYSLLLLVSSAALADVSVQPIRFQLTTADRVPISGGMFIYEVHKEKAGICFGPGWDGPKFFPMPCKKISFVDSASLNTDASGNVLLDAKKYSGLKASHARVRIGFSHYAVGCTEATAPNSFFILMGGENRDVVDNNSDSFCEFSVKGRRKISKLPEVIECRAKLTQAEIDAKIAAYRQQYCK